MYIYGRILRPCVLQGLTLSEERGERRERRVPDSLGGPKGSWLRHRSALALCFLSPNPLLLFSPAPAPLLFLWSCGGVSRSSASRSLCAISRCAWSAAAPLDIGRQAGRRAEGAFVGSFGAAISLGKARRRGRVVYCV